MKKLRTRLGKKPFIWARDICLLGVIIFAVSWWQTRDMLQDDGTVKVSQQNLVSLDGQVTPLLTDSKQTLVYFFAPWCQVCRLSIGNLDYVENPNVEVVRIALDYSSQEEVEAFVESAGITGKVLLGTYAHKNTFKIVGYPAYYLLNEKHEIVSKSFGYSTALGMKLNQLLH